MSPELSSDHEKEIIFSRLQFPPSVIDQLVETTREQIEYSALLFPDDFTGNRILNWLVSRMAEVGHGEKFSFGDGAQVSSISMSDLHTRMGGKKEFFRPGNRILDIGSGAGLALYQMSKKYEKQNIDVVGLDYAYAEGRPVSVEFGTYVAGIWSQLPFADNSFDGILCCESFPRHALADLASEHNRKIVGEVTRVAKPGAIWRATLFPDSYDKFDSEGVEEQRAKFAQVAVGFGWEVYIHPKLMIAKLTEKKV